VLLHRVEFNQLIKDEIGVLNLGQGSSDYFPPSYVTEALKQVAGSSNLSVHQYTRVSVITACLIFLVINNL